MCRRTCVDIQQIMLFGYVDEILDTDQKKGGKKKGEDERI